MPSPCQPQANRALRLLSVCLSCWKVTRTPGSCWAGDSCFEAVLQVSRDPVSHSLSLSLSS